MDRCNGVLEVKCGLTPTVDLIRWLNFGSGLFSFLFLDATRRE